jgi:hypothetical protein
MTDTAQVIATAATASLPWWHYLITALLGWAVPAAVAKSGVTVSGVVGKAQALAPAAETIATLAGQPALAGGIEMASKAIDAINRTQDPAQLAALVAVHAQSLAAAGEPPKS